MAKTRGDKPKPKPVTKPVKPRPGTLDDDPGDGGIRPPKPPKTP